MTVDSASSAAADNKLLGSPEEGKTSSNSGAFLKQDLQALVEDIYTYNNCSDAKRFTMFQNAPSNRPSLQSEGGQRSPPGKFREEVAFNATPCLSRAEIQQMAEAADGTLFPATCQPENVGESPSHPSVDDVASDWPAGSPLSDEVIEINIEVNMRDEMLLLIEDQRGQVWLPGGPGVVRRVTAKAFEIDASWRLRYPSSSAKDRRQRGHSGHRGAHRGVSMPETRFYAC